MATGSEVKAEMNALAKAHLAPLRHKPLSELAAMPEVHTEQRTIHGKAVSLSTYRLWQDSDHLLVAVQAFREIFLGISAQISVEGFLISSAGEVTQAPEETLWQFQ